MLRRLSVVSNPLWFMLAMVLAIVVGSYAQEVRRQQQPRPMILSCTVDHSAQETTPPAYLCIQKPAPTQGNSQ